MDSLPGYVVSSVGSTRTLPSEPGGSVPRNCLRARDSEVENSARCETERIVGIRRSLVQS
jgi:hypothetical protein